MPVLKDKELRLRPADMGDVTTALPWYSDPEVLKFSEGSNKKYDVKKVERMYNYLINTGEMYIIELNDGLRWMPIGDACLMANSLPIVIGDAIHRSQGLGHRVLFLLIDRAKHLGWKELNVKGIYSYNERSLRLYSSLGFQENGRRERNDGVTEVSMKLILD